MASREKDPKGVRREHLMEEFRRMKSYKEKFPAWYMFQLKSVEKLEGASLRHIQYWINKTGALVKMQTQIIKIQELRARDRDKFCVVTRIGWLRGGRRRLKRGK